VSYLGCGVSINRALPALKVSSISTMTTDPVVRAQGRKIIFTTKLPNIGDIDEALVRPGRCFATVRSMG